MNRNHPKLDLNDLHLLHLINHHQSITEAANAIQLTQSAISRRLQSIEQQLGVSIFHRTTRTLNITTAGKSLLRDTASIPNILDSALKRLSEDHLGGQKTISIGISPILSLAHLPGIFFPQTNNQADIKTIISQPLGDNLIQQVVTNRLDLAILDHQPKLQSLTQIHHQMLDTFCIILPIDQSAPSQKPAHFLKWAQQQSWILPPSASPPRELINQWLSKKDLNLSPTMELENFDLMCQLVALKMGVAFIPKRALTAFPRKKQLQHITLEQAPVRTLSVVGPKNTIIPPHIKNFTESILFS